MNLPFRIGNKKSSTYSFRSNEISYNIFKTQLSYERHLFKESPVNISVGTGFTAIPFKRYGKNSYKYGWFYSPSALFSINYSLSDKMFTFVGIRADYYRLNYYIFDEKFQINTYGMRSVIGFGFKLYKNIALKIAYTPYIFKNINPNLEIGRSPSFYLDTDFTLSYSFL